MIAWMPGKYIIIFLLCSAFSIHTLAGPGPDYQIVENKGQWPRHYDYAANVPSGKLFLEAGQFTYYFLDRSGMDHPAGNQHEESHQHNGPAKLDGHQIQVTLQNANVAVRPQALGQTPTYYNYFLGSDSCSWASRAYAYEGIVYPAIYPGVDMKIYTASGSLKYDFVISPMADPANVSLNYDGADKLFVDKDGDLHVVTSITEIIEKKPVAFQYVDGKKRFVNCRYRLTGNRLSFELPEGYDPCHELVIDPLLIFSTFSGSTADNWGSTATPGEHGMLYSAGVTTEENAGGTFPATNGAFQTANGGDYDVSILKYDSTGENLLYASYLGGAMTESAHSLVMNRDGDLLVLGTTSSANFPTTAQAYDKSFNGGTYVPNAIGTPSGVINGVIPYDNGSDIFVALISSDGATLKASTLLGGTGNDGINVLGGILTRNYGDQMRGDIIADDQNNIYISTVTSSVDFPIVNGLFPTYGGGGTDALLIKLSADLSSMLWSTYMGGNGMDASYTIQLDQSDNLFVAGGSSSTNFPTTSGVYQAVLRGNVDGWIANISSDGASLIASTMTGTTAYDQIYFLGLNSDDEVYVYGQTTGAIPVTPGVYANPGSGQFIQKFNHALTTLSFSTTIGSGRGIPDISPTAFLVNDCNNIYLTGWGGTVNSEYGYWNSSTVGLPVTSDAYQSTTRGSDFYFMVLTDDATEFLYGTFMGGSQTRTHVDGGTSRFDKGGIVYHSVCAGCRRSQNTTSTSDFPTTPGAWSRVNRSGNCNNAAFKFDLSSLKARIQSNSVRLNSPGLNRVCIPDAIVFQNFSTGGETFEWNLGDGTRLTKNDTSMVTHRYQETGQYIVWLKAVDKGTCIGADSVFTIVNVFIANTRVQDDDLVCQGSRYTLQASGGSFYSWTSADGSFTSNSPTPTVQPPDTTTYYVTVTESSGCFTRDTVQLNVVPAIKPSFEATRTAECIDRPFVMVKSTTDSLWADDRLFFEFGDGTSSDDSEAAHQYNKDGLYTIKLVAVRETCVTETTVPVPIFKLVIPNVITPINKDGKNDKFTIQYGEVVGITPQQYGFKTGLSIYNRWGKQVYHSDDYQYDWAGDGVDGGIYYYEVNIEGHSTCKSWIQLFK